MNMIITQKILYWLYHALVQERLVVKNPENQYAEKPENPGNQGDDVKYIYNFISTFFRSKYIWKSTAYFFIYL